MFMEHWSNKLTKIAPLRFFPKVGEADEHLTVGKEPLVSPVGEVFSTEALYGISLLSSESSEVVIQNLALVFKLALDNSCPANTTRKSSSAEAIDAVEMQLENGWMNKLLEIEDDAPTLMLCELRNRSHELS
jgi:hypothetical protein